MSRHFSTDWHRRMNGSQLSLYWESCSGAISAPEGASGTDKHQETTLQLLFLTGNFINNGLGSVAPTRCQSLFTLCKTF